MKSLSIKERLLFRRDNKVQCPITAVVTADLVLDHEPYAISY